MFSEKLLDHFRNPRNAGELPNPTASVEVSNPVCGDVLRLSARAQNGKILEVKFLCRGCTTSIACASMLTEMISGSAIAGWKTVSAEEIASSFAGLPAETFHGAHLAADGARALFAALRSNSNQ